LKAGLAGVALIVVAGCVDEDFNTGNDADGGEACTVGEIRCEGAMVQRCTGQSWETTVVCAPPEVCSAGLGRCADCDPGIDVCVGDEVHGCDVDGRVGALVKTCPPGKCQAGACVDRCGQAAASRSYVGCDYWPTVTSNSGLAQEFTFAVVVANAEKEPAEVTVESATNAKVAVATVAPGDVTTIVLPWVPSLKQTSPGASVLEPAGAYHLVSTVPVTVYQFNPLEYVVGKNCQKDDDDPLDGKCYSYSNDASLLLPEHALHTEYMVIARPTHLIRNIKLFSKTWSSSPGFFAVVAPKEGQTKLQITFSTATRAGTGSLAAYAAGQTASFTLSRWGVLQFVSHDPGSCQPASSDGLADYCDLGAAADLTGTIIKADRDVAVFSGHNCAFVPFDKWACDHLEEQLFPTRSLGKRYLVSHTASSNQNPALYRVVSAENGNQITFNPASVHGPVKLDAGKWVELASLEDFEIVGTGRLAVAQFMVGQNYSDVAEPVGDPSMALAVPAEQYRKSYRFLAPKTFEQSYVNVIAPKQASVTLDGKPVAESEYKPVGNEHKVAKLKIAGGAHLAESSMPFGIAVYGVGRYTSYMFPGGLDLKLID
jgi:hypothetical protein